MDENPHEAPPRRHSPSKEPWISLGTIAGLCWVGITFMVFCVLVGWYDPRAVDELLPKGLGQWYGWAFVAWLVSGALAVFSVIKLRRPSA